MSRNWRVLKKRQMDVREQVSTTRVDESGTGKKRGQRNGKVARGSSVLYEEDLAAARRNLQGKADAGPSPVHR